MLGSNIGNIYIYTLNTNDGDRIKKKEEEKKGKRKRKGKAPLSTPRDTKGQNAGEKKNVSYMHEYHLSKAVAY